MGAQRRCLVARRSAYTATRRHRWAARCWASSRRCRTLCCCSRARSWGSSGNMVISWLVTVECLLFTRAIRRERRSAWTPAGPFAGDDGPLLEDLAAPHAPGLAPLQRGGEATLTHGAGITQLLSLLELAWRVGEPQVGIRTSAGQLGDQPLDGGVLSRHWKSSFSTDSAEQSSVCGNGIADPGLCRASWSHEKGRGPRVRRSVARRRVALWLEVTPVHGRARCGIGGCCTRRCCAGSNQTGCLGACCHIVGAVDRGHLHGCHLPR